MLFIKGVVAINSIIFILMDKKSKMCKRIQLKVILTEKASSICQFLHILCIKDISKHVKHAYYSNSIWHYKYEHFFMVKLFIVMCVRQLSYNKTIASLTVEEALLLRIVNKNDDISMLTGATLHHFVKYRLREKGFRMDKKMRQFDYFKNIKI
jgi:hypothetical protein